MIRYAIFFLAVAVLNVSAQEKYWIYFTDKGTAELGFAAKSYTTDGSPRTLGIGVRALARRSRTSASSIDVLDLPPAPEYLDVLTSQGVVADASSRWLNAVSARLTPHQLAAVAGLHCVARVERVRVFRADPLPAAAAAHEQLRKTALPSLSGLDYGLSYDQVQQINVPRLHDLNITGRGVIVGMLDAGFRWRTHEALKNTTVLGEYDFIQNDTVTSNQSGDTADQDDHGTKTLSALGGYMPGQLIGPAYGASFLLAKTEYVPAELNIEEDHWVAGLEWLERSGADVVSTSLGYSEFDPGQHSYTYQEMNGRTAPTSKAAAIAARKGVLVCVAMGNEGATSWHYLTSPADADSIVSVGAVSGSGIVASFSSVGPTSDGRTKPDVCARGVSDYCASPAVSGVSSYVFNSGTSLSTPLVAGVAALVLSARPELTPMQLRDALRATASNTTSPDNSIGWGIVDAYKALLYNGLLISASLDVRLGADSVRTIRVTVLSPLRIIADSVLVHYSVDGSASFITRPLRVETTVTAATLSGIYTFDLPKQATHFYLTARDESGGSRSLPYRAPDMLFDANVKAVTSPQALPQSSVLAQNYPNPFNGRTTIQYALTSATHVSLTVYDILGRVVAVLVNDDQTPGYHTAAWDAGAGSSGVYFYSLRTQNFTETKKMIIVR